MIVLCFQAAETKPLGQLQKGSIEIAGCSVVVAQNSPIRGKEWVLRIVSPKNDNPIEIAAPSEEEMNDWMTKICETAKFFNDKVRNDGIMISL